MADLQPRHRSWEEFNAWIGELHVDWETLLTEAGLGESQRYVIKNRWGRNPRQMDKLYAAIGRIEEARIKPTKYGERAAALKEWQRIGAVLSQDMKAFERAISKARESAEEVESATLSPFTSVTAKPKGKRK